MKRITISALAIAILAYLVALPFEVGAARVKAWHHHRTGDYDRAQRKGVVLSDSGAMSLSRQLKPLVKLDASHVWAIVEDKVGTLYAATGDEGKVFKVTPEGKASIAYEGDAAQVLSLAVDAKGETVYAGTGPTARVVRIEETGAKVFCELPESYVWAIAVDPTGGLYAATGPNGRIYKVNSDGKARVFFETKQDHVLCLAVSRDGTLYAGTDKTGRVYRIDPKGKGFVVYQSAQTEVRSLLLTPDALYAGTSGTKKRSSGSSGGSNGSSTAKLVTKNDTERVSTPKAEKPLADDEKKKDKKEEKDEKKGSPAPSTPSAGENSVYRIAADGGVREVFRDKVLVMSLAKQGNRVLAGTGMVGQLFEVEESSRERTELARLDHGQITSLLPRKDGSLVVAAGDPGALYVLEDGYRSTGTLTSDVLDAKLVAKWGAPRWRADLPAKTGIEVFVRTGNVAEPDDTWSEWTKTRDGEAIKSPAARYMQYRVELTSEEASATPTLKSLTIRYGTTNQAPEVTKVEVPDLSASSSDSAKKLKFKWTATDPNEDELRYRLLVKKDGWDNWIELEDDYDKTDYEWDTTTATSGVYRLKVVASDHADNPAKETLTAERSSEPFVVCHTAPEVTLTKASSKDGCNVTAKAESPLVRLTSASYSINGGKWKNVFPEDGLFDSKQETFAFELNKMKAGTYVVVLKVTDAAGNSGSGEMVFTVK